MLARGFFVINSSKARNLKGLVNMFQKMRIFIFIGLFVFVVHAVFAADEVGKNNEIIFTPSGRGQRAIDYPGNVTVITRKDIEDSNAKYVYELLRRESGIYVKDYTHAAKTVLVDMRGFGETAGSNVLVMMDGRRVNEIDISGTDWSQIPLDNVERIEIVRGSGSVLYGDNATAGVINIITKKGEEGHHAKIGAEFGSYRYQDYYAGVYGAEKFASYNFFFEREKTDGYRLNGDYDGCDFTGSMNMIPADCLDIGLSGGYHKDWYGLPAGLQRWEIDRYGYRGSTTPNDPAKTETTFLRVNPVFHLVAGPMDHDLSIDFWGRKRRLDTPTWDHIFGGQQTWDNSQIDLKGGSVKYTDTFYLAGLTNKLTLGADVFSAENRLITVNPVWGTYNQLKIKKQTLGIYASNNVELLECVVVNGGFRQEWARFVFDQSENAARYEQKNPKQEAFDVGIEYKYLENGGIYGRFSRSFRFPATDEFYSRWTGLNTGLEHQKADTWEIGAKDRNWRYFQPSLNFFWMRTKNEIFYDPMIGAFGNNRNYDRIRMFGIEAGAVSDIFEWLNAYCNYTYVDAEYDGGKFASNKVPMVPEHKVAWGVNINPVEFLELNFNSEYISEQFSINDDRNMRAKLKPYFTCNGRVALKYKGAEVFFGINNIFDARYAEIAASNTAGTVTDLHPAPERNYVFGASWEF